MNVLLLGPWTRNPTRHFADGLAAHSRHDIRIVTRTARSGEMQAGALALAEKAHDATRAWTPDLLVATDRVDLPALLALTRRDFAHVPVLYILHESQLTYPERAATDPDGIGRDLTYAFINVLSMVAADRVVFNSQFHYDEVFGALPGLLGRFSDDTHASYLPGLLAKSGVMHPGLDLAALDAARPVALAERVRAPGPPVVLWNHRSEADNDPEAFLRLLGRLDDAGERFRLILVGETFAEPPPAVAAAVRRFGARVLHAGPAESLVDHAALLWRSDIVVSTRRHEYFDVPVLEAVHCGCHPLLPNRLVYPELVPPALHRPLLHAPVLYETEDDLFATLRRLLDGSDLPLPRDVLARVPARLAWPLHAERFDALFEEMGSGE